MSYIFTEDFSMSFNNLTTIELITVANDSRAKSKMDKDDMDNLILELSSRLEDVFYQALAVKESAKEYLSGRTAPASEGSRP